MRAFEIHIYQAGRWNIDSIFDDRDLAMHEAHRMDGSGRYVGVRVVEETFDESTDKTVSRTIFRGSRVDQANDDHLEQRKAVRAEAMGKRRKRHQAQSQQKKKKVNRTKKRASSPAKLIVMLTVIGGFAIGALIGLQYLQGMF